MFASFRENQTAMLGFTANKAYIVPRLLLHSESSLSLYILTQLNLSNPRCICELAQLFTLVMCTTISEPPSLVEMWTDPFFFILYYHHVWFLFFVFFVMWFLFFVSLSFLCHDDIVSISLCCFVVNYVCCKIVILRSCFFFSMCCVGAQLFHYLPHVFFLLFLLPPLKYKKTKKMYSLMCRGGDTALFFFLFFCLCFMALLYYWICVSKLITGFNTIPILVS